MDAFYDQFVLFNDDAPQLRSLRLVGVPIHWESRLLDNLMSLHLAEIEDEVGPSVKQFAAIVTRAGGGLQRLVLDRPGITSTPASEEFVPSTIWLPELRTCQVTRLDRDMCTWFAQFMNMPNVHTLISDPSHEDAEFLEEMRRVECPFPTVKTLRLQYSPLSNNSMFLMLTSFSTLVVIELFQCIVTDAGLKGMIWDHAQRLRGLTRLTLEESQGFSVCGLKAIVQSRLALAAEDPDLGLQELAVVGCSVPVTIDDLEWLRARISRMRWIVQASPS